MVIGVSVGTRDTLRREGILLPDDATVTEPSGSTALPRLLSMNSPRKLQRRRIGGFDAGLRHDGLMDPPKAMTTSSTMISDGDSGPAALGALATAAG